MLNTAVFKSIGFWIAVATAILGILLSQHVVAAGSTAAAIVGWLLTLLGSGGAGHQIASVPSDPSPAQTPPAA